MKFSPRGSSAIMHRPPTSRQGSPFRRLLPTRAKKQAAPTARATRSSTIIQPVAKALAEPGLKKKVAVCQ